eukprot:3489853-Alexandrium_andersonii.AAC.1
MPARGHLGKGALQGGAVPGKALGHEGRSERQPLHARCTSKLLEIRTRRPNMHSRELGCTQGAFMRVR